MANTLHATAQSNKERGEENITSILIEEKDAQSEVVWSGSFTLKHYDNEDSETIKQRLINMVKVAKQNADSSDTKVSQLNDALATFNEDYAK